MASKTKDYSIIDLAHFIQATRDSGYKNTPSAVAELVDNAVQANATEIQIQITDSGSQPDMPFVVEISDNGCGMTPGTLRKALRFGGSTRFGKRDGMGRFGMGLPNASLSQSRRVEVMTWTGPSRVITSYLDVDTHDIHGGLQIERHIPIAWHI